MARLGMTIDVSRCLGCQACLVACKAENEEAPGVFSLRLRHTVVGRFPDLVGEFRLEQCFHCDEPPCVPVCPTGATFQTDDGIVLIDPTRCTGCKACVTACPYGMRHVDPRGTVHKCTFCEPRLAAGHQPACVATCPARARAFGDLDDPDSDVRAAIAGASRVDAFDSRAGAEPKVFYLNARLFEIDDPDAETTVLSHFGGEA